MACFLMDGGKYINKLKQNKCCHCVVFKPGSYHFTEGGISIHSSPGGVSQITVPPMQTHKEPAKIHSAARTHAEDLFPTLTSPGVQLHQYVPDRNKRGANEYKEVMRNTKDSETI